MLLHIYCTKVLVVKLYYSTYICQLWSGDSNQISSKGGKRSNEQFRGGIIFLLYWPEHGFPSLTESSHALISPRCGDSSHLHTSHSILLLPVLHLKRRIERALQSMNDRGTHILNSICVSYKMVTLMPESFIMMLETFFAGDTKENCQSLKPVSVHYRNKPWIKNIGVHSF